MLKKRNTKNRQPTNPIADYLAHHRRKELDGTVLSLPIVTIQLPTPKNIVHQISRLLIKHNLIAQA